MNNEKYKTNIDELEVGMKVIHTYNQIKATIISIGEKDDIGIPIEVMTFNGYEDVWYENVKPLEPKKPKSVLKFSHIQDNNLFEVYINDMLHMTINKKNFNTLRSWKISPDKDPDPFFIQINSNGSTTVYQYYGFEKWTGILYQLSKMVL